MRPCVCLLQVESWIMEHGTEWVGESWDELKFIRQVRGYQGALVLSRREVRASGLLHGPR
jgi:hypothetical protein